MVADTVESITPHKMRGVRSILNSSAMDILYYTSPIYRSEVSSTDKWSGVGGGWGGGHKHTSIFSSLCDHGMKSSCNESMLQSCNTTSGLGFRSGMYVMALLLFAS